MEKLSVDRFEGKYAICFNELGEKVNVLIEKLPPQIKEGSILKKSDDGKFSLDMEGLKNLKEKLDDMGVTEKLTDLGEKLFKKDDKKEEEKKEENEE